MQYNLVGKYFEEIAKDTGKICFGIDDTLKALESGAVETLICWENSDLITVHIHNNETAGKGLIFRK